MGALAWLGLLAMIVSAPDRSAASEKRKILWPKRIEMFQGELAEVNVSGSELAAVAGKLGKEKVFFYANGASTFSAIIGADVAAKPGAAKLLLTAIDRAGRAVNAAVPFKVKAKAFHKESFNVPPGFDQMTPENLEEIRREQSSFAEAFTSSAPERLWDAPFVRPVPQEASASSFGSQRIINGVARAPHSGTDLSAPAGTEVLAANHGRAVLVGNFFFAGGSVVLDHGGGLFTMYFHLSEFKVEQGALVRKGDVIALSGSSGRVTGAHLHWGARLANARIDPLELLKKISNRWQPAQPVELPANQTEKQDGP
jgi:murein DD-endopeptidase MepM/ murein hydrolase activator NlpD